MEFEVCYCFALQIVQTDQQIQTTSVLLLTHIFFVQIDLKKMPLGKLSKKQITSAYGVLTELTKVSDMEKILVP